MSRNSNILDAIVSEGYVEINPNDASDFNIKDGELVAVSTRRGSIRIKAKVSDRPMANVVFIPFHFAEAAGTS